jgi:hypothetical protein
MTLTALVAAYGGDAEGLFALRPLAGATVLEHQVRRLAAAGVDKVLLLVEEWPPALSAPLGRLRADGIVVDAVRAFADVADRIVAEPRVLLVADGALPDRALIDRLSQATVPTLAALPDTPAFAAFERIDADMRWAGVAVLDGRRVSEAAAMLGEWDPVSTMMRRAVQEGAARIETPQPPLLADRVEALAQAEAGLVATSREAPIGWADRFIVLPLVDVGLPLFFARGIEPVWPAITALLLTAMGATAALLGYRWPALLLLLAGVPIARMATRLATVQARALPFARWLRGAIPAGLAIGAIGLGFGLMATTRQWGWLLVAGGTIGAFSGLAAQRRLLGWAGEARENVWLARAGDMPWALLPFAVAGAWGTGLAAIAGYAIGSLGWAMARLVRITRR